MTEKTGRTTPRRRRIRRWVLGVLTALVILVALAFGGYVYQNTTGLDRALDRTREAGFTERKANVDGRTLAYAEGPDNGPTLLLIHGQGSRWTDHVRVLPDLAETHHVYAVDVPGHGGSDRLDPSEYSNVAVGEILARFLEDVVGEPAIVSGHSSGGLLALHLAAEHPDLVTGLLLEDPPLFSSEMPRLLDTTGGGLPTLARDFITERGQVGPGAGFQRYFVENGDYFAFFGGAESAIVDYSLGWMDDHPGRPLEIWFLPPQVTVFFQGLVDYDPAFGAAWVDDRWYEGFDAEQALSAVRVPTTLVHTNYFEETTGSAVKDGVLMAAMDAEDVARARRLLPDGTPLVQVASGHLVHFEKPQEYLDALHDLTARVR